MGIVEQNPLFVASDNTFKKTLSAVLQKKWLTNINSNSFILFGQFMRYPNTYFMWFLIVVTQQSRMFDISPVVNSGSAVTISSNNVSLMLGQQHQK